MMRCVRSTVLGVLVVLGVGLSAAQADSCSCSAPDGSCSASISCDGACYASCANDGNCSSGCIGGAGDPGPFHKALPGVEGADDRLALTFDNLRAEGVSRLLSERLGVVVTFEPRDPELLLSLDVKGALPSQLLSILAEHGAVAVAGRPRPAHPATPEVVGLDTPLTLDMKEMSAQGVETLLQRLVGKPVTFRLPDRDGAINFQIKGATLRELLMVLARAGHLEIEGELVRPL